VLCASRGIVTITSLHAGRPQVIDACNPRAPKFLTRLATEAKEATDCFPDGPYFHIKYWEGAGELWDLSVPEKISWIQAQFGRRLQQARADGTLPPDRALPAKE
jgi:hypothetical protein